jgi:D-arginine dehydrogenase
MEDADILVIGAGIAGASFACFAAPHARVLLLEREAHPGMHSTGRSAAMYSASYGSAQVRALTRASRPFFDAPPAGFARQPILARRGALVVGSAAQAATVHALHEAVRAHDAPVLLLDGAAVRAQVPVLEPQQAQVGLLEPDAADIDVNELHLGYLRAVRAHGGRIVCGAEASTIEHSSGQWEVSDGERGFRAPLLVNAAGAWVDEVAARAGVAALGIEPRRRSAFLFEAPAGVDFARWPLVIDADETFYFKPDAGLLLGSCANADPVAPHDVVPEEIDIALGIHRIEAATTLRIRRPVRTWAGLRSFVADGDLVGGFAPGAPGFFWLAAQGGYGIQTSAAMGQACASLALGHPLPAPLQDAGIGAAMLAPRAKAPGTAPAAYQ